MDADVQAATAELLDAKPDIEADLRATVDIDREGPWQFGDIPLDSGVFGELVAAGIATQTDEGYRLADRAAVLAALDGEAAASNSGASRSTVFNRLSASDYRQAFFATTALAFVALVRITPMVGSTFRDDRVVLAGNDPYMYRAAAEKLLASELAAFDLGSLGQLTMPLTGTPIQLHDTLMIVFAWWGSALFGGDAAVGTVLAWYPPLAGLLTALGVLGVTTRVSGDYRAGLAATILLAVTPAHAFRTALGFGDHHAFDYLWLIVTLAAIVSVAGAHHTRRSWLRSRSILLAVFVGGFAITAQLAAWRGSPLYLLPIALYAFSRTLLDVRRDQDPLGENLPLVAMLAVGTITTASLHLAFGWLPLYRVLAPALILGGTVGVVGVASVAQRRGVGVRNVLAADLIGGAVTAGIVWFTIPAVSDALSAFTGYLVRYGASGIAETQSLFAGSLGSIAAPFLLFGFVFFLALPYVVWAGYHTLGGDGRPDLLVVVAYAVVFTLLSIVQNRFAGQLALCLAPFAGIGFIHIADRTEMIDAPNLLAGPNAGVGPRGASESSTVTEAIPSRRTLRQLFVLFIFLGGLGGLQTPIKMSQIAVDDDTAATAMWVNDHASTDAKSAHPYVLTRWDQSRPVNFLAGGEYVTYEDYGYARATFVEFVTTQSSEEWYDRLTADGVDYIVVNNRTTADLPPQALGARLTRHYGSASAEATGLGHYRAVHNVNSLTVFELVSGARLAGEAAPDSSVTVRTTFEIDGQSITYTRTVETDASGSYTVTVPYPGSYSVGDATVEVSETDVQRGASVRVSG